LAKVQGPKNPCLPKSLPSIPGRGETKRKTESKEINGVDEKRWTSKNLYSGIDGHPSTLSTRKKKVKFQKREGDQWDIKFW